MRPPEVPFEREPLYEEVWSQPITKLAAKYGLSDNGLRKICTAMEIPVPACGYWAKLAARHSVQRAPLPVDAGRTTSVARPPAPVERQFRRDEDKRWLAERLAREAQEGFRVVVDPAPAKWHPELRDLRARLQADQAKYEGELREHQRDQALRAKDRRPPSSPDFSPSAGTGAFAAAGSCSTRTAHARFASQQERGLRPWHWSTPSFLPPRRGASRRTVDGKKGRFILSLEAADLSFALREPGC